MRSTIITYTDIEKEENNQFITIDDNTHHTMMAIGGAPTNLNPIN